MCYNCGCHNPQDDMGSPDNITAKMLQDLAVRLNFPENELTEKLYQYLAGGKNDIAEFEMMFEKAAKAWGQSVEEAKKNTLTLLQEELHH